MINIPTFVYVSIVVLTHRGLNKMVDIFAADDILNSFSYLKIVLFEKTNRYNLFLRVHWTRGQHWIKYRLGDTHAESRYVNYWWLKLLMHIFITWPWWFNPLRPTETEMLSFWWNFHHWLHWKLSFWQLSVQPVMKISSKRRHFRFSA